MRVVLEEASLKTWTETVQGILWEKLKNSAPKYVYYLLSHGSLL
jgi:hypothetical protein